jgi:hypothetical protein
VDLRQTVRRSIQIDSPNTNSNSAYLPTIN